MSEAELARRMRVMIVDDQEDAARALQLLLRMFGHEVVHCPNGREALDAFSAFNPDVALLDIEMPGMHGGELAAALRSLKPQLIIMALTSVERDDPRIRNYWHAFDKFLSKPWSLNQLEALFAHGSIARRDDERGEAGEEGAPV